MANAVWNGFLRLSLISCPVHLVAAIREPKPVRLDPLNERTGNPVSQQYVDVKTGNVVPADSVIKGQQGEDGGWVAVSRDEMEKLSGEPSNMVELAQFVPRDRIDRALLDTPYYVYSEGPLASDTMHALRLAMVRTGRAGVGRIHLGGRNRFAILEPHGAGLMLSTMRNAPEMETPEFEDRPDSDIPTEMVEIVEAIINRRAAEFDPGALRDRFDDELRALLENKAKAPASSSGGAGGSGAGHAASPPSSPAQSPAASTAVPTVPMTAGSALAPHGEETPPPPLPQAAPLRGEEPEAVASPPEAAAPPSTSSESMPEHQTAAAESDDSGAAEPEPRGAEEGQELGTEILLHIMGLGDRRYVESGWAGQPGSRRQIEAVSIRPRDDMAPSTVEFRVFAQEGRATAWVSNGNYAGTRGRGLPLTGFAVRPSPELRDRLDIVYEGCFFEGGVVGPKRNGEVCASPVGDDPLEAIRVQIYQRAPE